MEAKLGITEYNVFNKIFSTLLRKEESRDAVVPDILPDISEILCCEGLLLIRSKDVTVGRVRTEVNVNSNVLYKGEDGNIYFINVTVPIVLITEDDIIDESHMACAKTELIKLEARALNPRKILVRAELGGEISVFENSKFNINKNVDDDEHIRSKICSKDVSYISSVCEKTFVLTDEVKLPMSEEGVGNVTFSGCSCAVDDIKAVGTKLIVKGRIKCGFFYINKHGEISRFENISDYSQIVELGRDAAQGLKKIWIIPSGAYCNYNENENRISLELHLVAQVICRDTIALEYINDCYSNRYNLIRDKKEIKLEYFEDPIKIRDNLRQLFESSAAISNIIYSTLRTENPTISSSEIKLPVNFSLICRNGENIWSECRRAEFSVRLPNEKKDYIVNSVDIVDWTVIPVPGGIELRLEVSAEICAFNDVKIEYISAITYNEDEILDNSEKPSITLLRVNKDDELWEIAKNNCSSPTAILSANSIADLSSVVGKMILIPKTY